MSIHPYYQGPFYRRLDKGQLIAYPLSGAITTLTDYLVFWLLFTVSGSDLLVATATAYMAGLVVSYLQNRYWVFKKGANRQSEGSSLWRYIAFLAVNLAITYAILWALENWLAISPYIGKMVVNTFMFFWIYIGNTFFVFRGQKVGPIQL